MDSLPDALCGVGLGLAWGAAMILALLVPLVPKKPKGKEDDNDN